MGLYAEPKGYKSKREWCEQKGERFLAPTWEAIPAGKLAVAWIDNGAFQAVAIATGKREFLRLYHGRDDAIWFLIDKAEVRQQTPGGERLRELK